ncbi:MAG: hypothetical protein J6S14_17185 [Clostridia bacterium]|nr:hypothetical protein [Clostridia bacterium]
MYTILVDQSNNLITTEKETIMHRSKLVNTLCFLANPTYNEVDMTGCTVLLEYVRPISRKYETETLSVAADDYNGYLQYMLPVDTNITKEPGDVELALSFIKVEMTGDGKVKTPVRKTAPTTLTVHSTAAWADVIPDEALSAIDQRIIKTDAQIKALEEMSVLMEMTKADDLIYDKETGEIQLTAGGEPIGGKVDLIGDKDIRDGVPVVEFSKSDEPSVDENGEIDNVVEFGNNLPEEQDNVVEF